MATDQRSLARGVEYLSSWLSYRRPYANVTGYAVAVSEGVPIGGVARRNAPRSSSPSPASLLCPPFRPPLRIAVGLSIAHTLTSCRPVAGVLGPGWFGPGFCFMTHPSLGPEEVARGKAETVSRGGHIEHRLPMPASVADAEVACRGLASGT
jgi:hypothetical protein